MTARVTHGYWSAFYFTKFLNKPNDLFILSSKIKELTDVVLFDVTVNVYKTDTKIVNYA